MPRALSVTLFILIFSLIAMAYTIRMHLDVMKLVHIPDVKESSVTTDSDS